MVDISKLNKPLKVRKRKTHAVNLDFNDDIEMFLQLDQYRRLQGWTWKYMFLLGVAEAINREGDNDDLVLTVVNYITRERNK